MKRMIKLAGFDLDGTLLTTDKRVTEYTCRVLEEAARQGMVLVPVTGRTLHNIPDQVLSLPAVRYVIAANGGKIIDTATDTVLYERLLSVEKGRKILDILEEYDTLREVYYDEIGYMTAQELDAVEDYVGDPYLADYIRSTRESVPDTRAKFEEEQRPLDKIHAYFRDLTERQEAMSRIEALGGCSATASIYHNVDIGAAGVSKGKALLFLADALSISPAETAAFGDGTNDRSMIEDAGIGVAMANAVEEIKNAADAVTTSNDEDGVARYLQAYLEEPG